MFKGEKGFDISGENKKNPETTEPEPAESFEVEFLNTRVEKVKGVMSGIGDFVFKRSGTESEGEVYFEGERGDGTKIRITIEKGDEYKSPKEITDDLEEKLKDQ